MATTELTRSPADGPATRPLAFLRRPLPAAFSAADARSIALTWTASRAAMFVVVGLVGGPVTGDVRYYARSLHSMFYGGSLGSTLKEYPVPVLGIMVPQFLIGALSTVAFAFLFVASMLAVDAIFTAFLWRMTGRRLSPAVAFWLLFLPAVGGLAYFRFDLVPAVLTCAAVLAMVRRPRWTGVLTGVGTALKLWPVVLLPVFLLRRTGRATVLVAFAVTAGVLAGVSLAVGGYGRLVSPIHWQAARGLQIESVPATPLMIARIFHPHEIWQVHTSAYKATELFGAGVHAMAVASTALTVVALLVLTWLWLRCRRAPELTTLAWLILTAAAVLTVTNKTLSPQYILWLGGPVAALFVLAPADSAVRRIARVLIALSVCTQLIYPIWYGRLVNVGWAIVPMTMLLTVRNVLLCWLAWLAGAEVVRRTRAAS